MQSVSDDDARKRLLLSLSILVHCSSSSSSSCCCCSRVERASQQAAADQFQIFADIEALETSIRAERGYTTSVVLLEGVDAEANVMMAKQRSHTDEILLNLSV